MHRGQMSRFASVFIVASLVTVSNSLADIYDVTLPIEQFGNLCQHDVPVFGSWACGPTSATNGFVYLENAYPQLYGHSLVPLQDQDLNQDGSVNQYDDMIATVQLLGSDEYMRTATLGVTPRDLFVCEQARYIDERAPNTTVYAAQTIYTWPYHERPAWCEPVDPEWDFIYNGLDSGSAVTILVMWPGGGHYLTLNGLHWNDADGNGVVEQTENATLDYMDPWTGEPGGVNFWFQGGHLRTNYVPGGHIRGVFTVIPLPEPSTGLIASLAGLICLRKRV